MKLLIQISSRVWVAGVVLLLAYTAISYWRLRRKVDTAVRYKDNIFQSENVSSPFVLGIIKPRIYLPFNMNDQDLEHVVAHEQAHIRRKDHWWKPLGFLLLTIHWFNPLMWLAYVLLCRDIELACDEKVIKELGNEQRADYTQALVACSVNRRMIAACPLAFGEVGVKERVKSVMNYKKPTFWIVVLAIVTCVIVAVCFLTNPTDDDLYAPEPFGHSYRVGEIVYQDLQYSFGYTSDTTPRYSLTSDYQLFVAGDALSSMDLQEWVQYPGTFEEVKLSGLIFNDYFKEPGNLSGWNGDKYDAESLRRQTKQAWRFDVKDNDSNVFYYLILTHTDKVFLTYGYDVGDAHAEVEDGSLIRWVFELERTDLLTCNAISEDCNAYIEPNYYPNGFDWEYDDLPSGTINKSGKLVFTANWNTDTLVVSEDYYRDYGNSTHIEKETYTLYKNDDGKFELDVSLRGNQSEKAFYFIQADTGVYVMKIVLGTDVAPLINHDEKLHLGLNAEITDIDVENHILYVKDIDEDASVFGDKCAIDCTEAISEYNLLYTNYETGDVKSIEFSDFQVGDAIIIGLHDSEKQKAFNGAVVAEQIQLGTQRMNQSSSANVVNDEDPDLKYYLTIGAEGVKSIELSMPNSSGGFVNADGSLLKKGERIWLENLDGYADLRGLTITALGENGEIIWTASIPDGEENKGFTHLVNDDWEITNIE